jgi:hypothetical protein
MVKDGVVGRAGVVSSGSHPCSTLAERRKSGVFSFSGELGQWRWLRAPQSLLSSPSFFPSSPLLLAVLGSNSATSAVARRMEG